MPRSFIDKIAQGTRRVVPDVNKLVTGTPPANSRMHLFQFGTSPAAGTYPGAALAMQQIVGGTTPSLNGGITIVADPTAPNKQYLTRSSLKNLVASGKGRLYILDLLVTYNTITTNVTTAAQTMTASAGGADVRPRTANRRTQLMLDVTTALGGVAANITAGYTKTVTNTAGRSSGAQALVVSSIQGRLPLSPLFMPLQAGDEGVASLQTLTVSALMGAGVIAACLVDLLAIIDISADTEPRERAYVTDQAALIEIPTGAALSYIWEPISAVASQQLAVTHDFAECDLTAA